MNLHQSSSLQHSFFTLLRSDADAAHRLICSFLQAILSNSVFILSSQETPHPANIFVIFPHEGSPWLKSPHLAKHSGGCQVDALLSTREVGLCGIGQHASKLLAFDKPSHFAPQPSPENHPPSSVHNAGLSIACCSAAPAVLFGSNCFAVNASRYFSTSHVYKHLYCPRIFCAMSGRELFPRSLT